MTTSLRDTLARQANLAGEPSFDIDALVAQGEGRLRRRRIATVLGGAVGVVLVIALALGGAALTNPSTEPDRDPVEQPSPDEPLAGAVRKIAYADVTDVGGAAVRGESDRWIHYGNTRVETGHTYVNLDSTDEGFAYTTDDGRVWFSDGGTVERLGSHACTRNIDGRVTFSPKAVVSGNAGSLLVWFDCTDREHPELVVYDTRTESATRRAVASCGRLGGPPPSSFCDLQGVVGDHVYWVRSVYGNQLRDEQLVRYDVSTDELARVPQRDYLLDVRTQPRGLVVGDSWVTGATTDGIGQDFLVVGRRLVARTLDTNGVPGTGAGPTTRAFHTATGTPVRLQVPAGYSGAEFRLFEWLDDETVALGSGVNSHGDGFQAQHVADILRCSLHTGRCDVAVEGPGKLNDGDGGSSLWQRVVPYLGLAG